MNNLCHVNYQKTYNFENELSGYAINIDGSTEVEGEQYKCRLIFNYEINEEGLISYVECPENQDIETAIAYEAVVLPKGMLKILGTCLFNAEQIMKDIIEADAHQPEENISDT